MPSIAQVLVTSALVCATGQAWAAGSQTFSVFDSSGMNRQIHGRQSVVDLAAGPLRLGDASAFFGVDSLSNDANHYLTSGLQWRSGNTEGRQPLVMVGAMHTAARGASIGSQTLIRAETQLDLGRRWYLPDLTLETDQLSSSGEQGAALAGRATHLGFGQDLGSSAYHIAYFRSGHDYNPWGSALAPGDRGVEISGSYGLGSRWRLSNTLRVHDGAIRTGTEHGLVDKWRLSGVDSPSESGQPWHLSAQFGGAGLAPDAQRTPLALELASRTARWRDWHVDSALGWYQGGIATPDAIPVRGGLWQVSASHFVDLGGLQTRVQPSFSVGGSQYGEPGLGSRTGLAMGFPGLLDNVDLSVDYLSAGWGPTVGRPDMQLSLSVSQNAGTILPRLGSLIDRLRGGWFEH